MATCQTTRWGDDWSPIVKLTVTESSSTASTVTLSYKLQYITDYKAYTNGNGRAYSIVIDGTTVKSGTYNIDEVTGTKTIASGTTTVNKGTSAKNISFSCSFYFDVTWNGVYSGTRTASGSISIGAKTSYTVSYNANGGSGAPSAQTKWHGDNLTLSSTKPTRTGYTFQGWSTANDSTVEYAAGATYSSNAAVTLYAVWKINTYTVSYNANGGSGAPANQTKTYGTALTLSSTKPTRTGYTFQGWGTSANATTVSYAPGASYTTNAGATLYAIWKINTYTVSYNANGGKNAPSNQTKTYDITLTLSSTKPTRTGYTFQGWSTANDSTVEYAAGASYKTNASVTLYAVWKINTYTNTIYHWKYVGTGGNNSDGTFYRNSSEDTTFTGTYNSSVTIPTSHIKTYTGHSNNGIAGSYWGSSSWSSKNIGSTFTQPASGITMEYYYYPYTYTISFNANGGSGAPNNQTKTYGVNLTLSSTKPTRTGYTFTGWKATNRPDGQNVLYQPGETVTYNGDQTMIAQWQANTYKISYDANGGSGAPSDQTKTYGITLVLSSTIPTRNGYTFLGWATSSTATTATYSAGGNYTANNKATLYAVWAQSSFIQTIMARYQEANGSYTNYSQVYAATLNQGDTCSWSSPETIEYKAASISYIVGTSSETKYITVYRKQYTILYNANGGLHAPKTQTFYYGCDLHLTDKRPTRSGYDFLGWAYTSNAEEIKYKQGDIYDSTDISNPILYAIWSKRNTNIYLYDIGLCEASEYIEDDSFSFDTNGTIYANSFVEETLENGKFAIGTEFIASEISEIYIERYYLIDEQGNRLTDENGNYLFLEEEV